MAARLILFLLFPFLSSHVASIAAGNHGVPVVVNGFDYGYASGMAPAARIAVYKALYPEGGTLSDVIAAIDQAVRDGVDVLTLSIGPDDPPEYVPVFMSVFDITLLFARRAGVFVAQAAGNRGPGRSTVVSYSPWSVAVASASTDRNYNGTIVLGHGNHRHHHHHQLTGFGLSGPTSRNGNFRFKLVAAKDCVTETGNNNNNSFTQEYAEECQHAEALRSNLVKGSIVICNFSTGFANGTSTVLGLVNTAIALGFMGFVLVANPSYGDLVAQPLPFIIPGIVIPKLQDAKMLINYYEKHTKRDKRGNAIEFNGRASILEGRVARFDVDTSIFVPRFSSRGPDIVDSNLNPADVLKPDILAPGHQIWAAWSPISARDPFLQGYRFALMSGTSMSTPHVSGIAALLKELRPTWTPSTIASSMSTTASKLDHKGKAIMSQGSSQLNTLYPSTPFDLGAGMINPSKSADPGLVFYSGFEDYVAFLCSLPNTNPWRVLKTTGRSCSNTTISLLSPSDLNLPSVTVSNLNGSLQVKREVTNVAAISETYLVSVLEPRGVKVEIVPSSFNILPEGRQNISITLKVVDHMMEDFSFGEIVLTGSLDHIVRMPLSVRSTLFGSS